MMFRLDLANGDDVVSAPLWFIRRFPPPIELPARVFVLRVNEPIAEDDLIRPFFAGFAVSGPWVKAWGEVMHAYPA